MNLIYAPQHLRPGQICLYTLFNTICHSFKMFQGGLMYNLLCAVWPCHCYGLLGLARLPKSIARSCRRYLCRSSMKFQMFQVFPMAQVFVCPWPLLVWSGASTQRSRCRCVTWQLSGLIWSMDIDGCRWKFRNSFQLQ